MANTCPKVVEVDIPLCGGKVKYKIQNPEVSHKEGQKVIACEIRKRKIRGFGNLFRLSIIEQPDGGRFVQVENNEDIAGSCAEVITKFRTITPREHDKQPIDKMSTSFWKKHNR